MGFDYNFIQHQEIRSQLRGLHSLPAWLWSQVNPAGQLEGTTASWENVAGQMFWLCDAKFS